MISSVIFTLRKHLIRHGEQEGIWLRLRIWLLIGTLFTSWFSFSNWYYENRISQSCRWSLKLFEFLNNVAFLDFCHDWWFKGHDRIHRKSNHDIKVTRHSELFGWTLKRNDYKLHNPMTVFNYPHPKSSLHNISQSSHPSWIHNPSTSTRGRISN
jgi:hypothetical protein